MSQEMADIERKLLLFSLLGRKGGYPSASYVIMNPWLLFRLFILQRHLSMTDPSVCAVYPPTPRADVRSQTSHDTAPPLFIRKWSVKFK